MTERFVPTEATIVRDLQSQVVVAKKARGGSLLSVVEKISDKADEATGTKEGHESWKRLLGFIAIVVGGTLIAGEIPNKDVAMAASDGLAIIGGAFAGNQLRPISRIGRFNRDKFVAKLGKRENYPLNPQEMTDFFATFDDVLTEEGIKDMLLNRNGKREDPRYPFVRIFSQIYRSQNGTPRKTDERQRERIEIKERLDRFQLNGQTQRANKDLIAREGTRRVWDIASGVAVLGTAAALINVALHGAQGGMIGAMDDVVTVAVIFGSVALRKLDESGRRNQSGKLGQTAKPVDIHKSSHLRLLRLPTHHDSKDKRAVIGKGGHGSAQR
jgi:hypothetical protein